MNTLTDHNQINLYYLELFIFNHKSLTCLTASVVYIMIFYLIYTSTPRNTVTRESLDEITNISIANNAKANVTGMLLGIENKFLQFLEGDEKDVLEVYNRIKNDPRHKDVNLWVKGFADQRTFQSWSMGSWLLTNEELEKLEALNELKAFLNDPVNNNLQSKKFLTMMNGLLKTWIAHEPERVKKMRL